MAKSLRHRGGLGILASLGVVMLSGILTAVLGQQGPTEHWGFRPVVAVSVPVVKGTTCSLYLQQRRTQVDTLFQLFDAPAIVSSCGLQPTSTVPLQALALLNSDSARLRAKADAEQRAWIDLAQMILICNPLLCVE